jgi:hypothetical protein
MGYPKVAKAVSDVLRMKAKRGQTTKTEATMLTLRKIENLGGPTKFGIGVAAMNMAMMHIVGNEVTRQLKMPLTDHDATFVMPKTIRDEVKEICEKVPRWIAIADGADAIWVHTLKARPEHWEANGNMKNKKAVQTQLKADISTEVALFLIDKGFDNLEEAIRS